MGNTPDLKWYPDADTPFGADDDLRKMMESFGGIGYVETEAARDALPASENPVLAYVKENRAIELRDGQDWYTIRRFGSDTQDVRFWSSARTKDDMIGAGVNGSLAGLSIPSPKPGFYSLGCQFMTAQNIVRSTVYYTLMINGGAFFSATKTLEMAAYDAFWFSDVIFYSNPPASLSLELLVSTSGGTMTCRAGSRVTVRRIGDL